MTKVIHRADKRHFNPLLRRIGLHYEKTHPAYDIHFRNI